VCSFAPLALADNGTEDINETVEVNETEDVDETVEVNETEDVDETEVVNETEETDTEEDTEETEEEDEEIEETEEEVEEDDETGDVDEETQEEIEAMDNKDGAEVRLLQLELAIAKGIAKGNDVIAKAQELEKDTSELEAIIAEMETLKEDVAAADPAAEDAVQTFVDLKKDARDLAKQFREKAREIIPANEANRLKERLKEKKMEKLIGEINNLEEKLKEKRKEFNALRLGALYRKLNIEDTGIIEKVKSGEITVKEVKTQTREKFKAMAPEERRKAFTAAKEAGVKRAVAAEAKADKVKLGFIDRKETRLTQRLDKLSGKEGIKPETLQKHTEDRLKKLEQAKTRVESKAGKNVRSGQPTRPAGR